MTLRTNYFLALTSMTLLVGCATNQGYIHDNSGQSVDVAMDAHIVDKSATPGAPVMHADKSNAAVQRYLDDEVKKPQGQAQVGFGRGSASGSN